MRDRDIRAALKRHLLAAHSAEETLVLDELEVCGGDARADLAMVNGVFAGYEIKSEHDTLTRLASQVNCYGRVFERAALVSVTSHLRKALPIIPEWWGVLTVCGTPSDAVVAVERESQRNPAIDVHAVGMLLWRREALQILERYGIDGGVRSKPTACMVSRLCEALTLDDLLAAVRQAFKARGDWRSGAKQKQCDEQCQLLPTPSSRRTVRPVRTLR